MFGNLFDTNDNHATVVAAALLSLFVWHASTNVAISAGATSQLTPPTPPLLLGQIGRDYDEAIKFAQIELSKGSFQTATDNYRAAVKFKPEQATAHLGLGRALMGLGLNEEAQQEIFQSLQLDPSLVAARALWGSILMKKDSWDEAAGQFLQVLKVEPNDLPTRGDLGICYEQKGQLDAAIEQFRYIIQTDPTNIDGHYNLACAYDLKNQYDAAAGEYARVLQLNPKHSFALVQLGNCLCNQRQYAKAIKFHQAEIKLHPDNYYAYIGLGRVYELMDKPKEAQFQYKRAISIAPKAPECQKLMQNMMKVRAKELGLQQLIH